MPEGSTIILSVHIPFEYDTAEHEERSGMPLPGDNELYHAQHLYKLLAPYKVHFMSGNTHWNQRFEKGNMFHHIQGAICGAWWGGNTSFDGTPLGFSVYEIKGDSLSWYYQSAGKDKNYQMQLTYEDSTQTVIANVWNWDNKWKVELLEDDNNAVNMDRFVGYSPVMKAYYESLPANRPWMRPVATAHLFRKRLSSNVKIVKVKVTDRFGNIFIDAIDIKSAQ